MLQNQKAGIIMHISGPWISGADQFLERILTALIEGTDGRLIDDVGSSGLYKSLDKGIAHLQSTSGATDASADVRIKCAVLGIIAWSEVGIGECRLCLTVPYFLVNLVGQPLHASLGIIPWAVVITYHVGGIHKFLILLQIVSNRV